MFRHRGKTRTLKHNLQIASLLSFVAGIVNVAGFLSVQRLTTNVTGHFAFLVDEVFKFNLAQAVVMFLYLFCFFCGVISVWFAFWNYVKKKRAIYLYNARCHWTGHSYIRLVCKYFIHRPAPRYYCMQPTFCHGLAKFFGYHHIRFGSTNHSFNRLIHRLGDRIIIAILLQPGCRAQETSIFHQT